MHSLSLHSAASYLHCKQQSNSKRSNWTETDSNTTTDSRDHLNRTKNLERRNSMVPATVVDVRMLSSSVKGIKLLVKKQHRLAASFQAGQWVDMMIPGVDTIGGFSICNSPHSLLQDGCLELAVKFSDHPPAFWIHTECKVGSHVAVRVGGNFFYKETNNKNVLLVAGGVGINPLLSILRHRRDLYKKHQNDTYNTALLYSAKTHQHLIFEDVIRQICDSLPSKCQFHLTKDKNSALGFENSPNITLSREKISKEIIADFMMPFQPISTDCYICGPPIFIDKMKEYLLNLGCLERTIFYEKWW